MLTACAKKPSASAVWAPSAHNLRPDRLHLHYGPIDLLIDVDADSHTISIAHKAARAAFDGVLESLVAELPLLRKPITSAYAASDEPAGPVAKLMWHACLPYANQFVTPMAAVAGSVADYLLNAIVTAAPCANRVWVNNGGDIALWLSPGTQTTLAVFQNNAKHAASITLSAQDGVCGVATSGWPGRSHSLGIADAVTVLASSAAAADVAATLIANAVRLPNTELDAHYVERTPANELHTDSDLTNTPVTVAVSALPKPLCQAAVKNGMHEAQRLLHKSNLLGVFIDCQGHRESLGDCA